MFFSFEKIFNLFWWFYKRLIDQFRKIRRLRKHRPFYSLQKILACTSYLYMKLYLFIPTSSFDVTAIFSNLLDIIANPQSTHAFNPEITSDAETLSIKWNFFATFLMICQIWKLKSCQLAPRFLNLYNYLDKRPQQKPSIRSIYLTVMMKQMTMTSIISVKSSYVVLSDNLTFSQHLLSTDRRWIIILWRRVQEMVPCLVCILCFPSRLPVLGLLIGVWVLTVSQ